MGKRAEEEGGYSPPGYTDPHSHSWTYPPPEHTTRGFGFDLGFEIRWLHCTRSMQKFFHCTHSDSDFDSDPFTVPILGTDLHPRDRCPFQFYYISIRLSESKSEPVEKFCIVEECSPAVHISYKHGRFSCLFQFNDVEAGGNTVFTNLSISVTPVKVSLLISHL